MERNEDSNELIAKVRFKKDFVDSTIFLNDFLRARTTFRSIWPEICKNWNEGGEKILIDIYNQWENQYGKEKSALAITRLVADQEGNDESNNSTGLRVSKILESRNMPDDVKGKLKELINGQGIFESFDIYSDSIDLRSKIKTPIRRYASFMKSIVKQFSISEMVELCDFDHYAWVEKFYGKSKDLLTEINQGRTLNITSQQKQYIIAEANESDQFFLDIPALNFELNKNLAEFTISNGRNNSIPLQHFSK